MDRAMEYEGLEPIVEKGEFPEVLQVGMAVSDGQKGLELYLPVGKGVFYFADEDQISFFKEQLELLLARTVSSMSEDMLWITMVDYSKECRFRIIHDALKPNTSFIKTAGELETFMVEMNELVMERDRRLGEAHNDLKSFNMTAEKRYPYHLVVLNLGTVTLDAEAEKIWLQMGRIFERVGVVVYGIGPSDQKEPDPYRSHFVEQFSKGMLHISRSGDALVVKNGGAKSSELYAGHRLEFIDIEFEDTIGLMTRTPYRNNVVPADSKPLEIPIAFTAGNSVRWCIAENRSCNVVIGGNRRSGKTNLLDCMSFELNAATHEGAFIVKRLNSLSGWDYLFDGGFLTDLKRRESERAVLGMDRHHTDQRSDGLHSDERPHTVLLVDDPKAIFDGLSIQRKRAFELLMMTYLPIMHLLGYTMVMVIGSNNEPWVPRTVLEWVPNRIGFKLDPDSPSAEYFPARSQDLEQFEVDFHEMGANGMNGERGHVLFADASRVV